MYNYSVHIYAGLREKLRRERRARLEYMVRNNNLLVHVAAAAVYSNGSEYIWVHTYPRTKRLIKLHTVTLVKNEIFISGMNPPKKNTDFWPIWHVNSLSFHYQVLSERENVPIF